MFLLVLKGGEGVSTRYCKRGIVGNSVDHSQNS